eukprot:gene15462-18306_t
MQYAYAALTEEVMVIAGRAGWMYRDNGTVAVIALGTDNSYYGGGQLLAYYNLEEGGETGVYVSDLANMESSEARGRLFNSPEWVEENPTTPGWHPLELIPDSVYSVEFNGMDSYLTLPVVANIISVSVWAYVHTYQPGSRGVNSADLFLLDAVDAINGHFNTAGIGYAWATVWVDGREVLRRFGSVTHGAWCHLHLQASEKLNPTRLFMMAGEAGEEGFLKGRLAE